MASTNCPSCAAKVSKGRQFCGNCGTAMPQAEARKPVAKKTVGIILGSVTGIVALVAIYLVFFPAPLTAKSLQITLDTPTKFLVWEGDSLAISAKVSLLEQREDKIRVSLETKSSSASEWVEIGSSVGKFPTVEVASEVKAVDPSHDFRVLVYLEDQTEPIATSDVQSVQIRKAFLPDKCPTDELNRIRGYTGSEPYEQIGYVSTKSHKDCSIGRPYSDLPDEIYIDYRVKTIKQFTNGMKKHKGESIKLGLNENAAYVIKGESFENSDYYIPDTYVIFYHGIELTTDGTSEEDLKAQINAIVIK